MTNVMIPTNTESIVTIAAQFAAAAKEATKVADAAWKDAEADAIDVFIDAEVSTVLIDATDGTKTRVTLEGIDEVSRSIDVTALAELIPATVLAEVTKVSIDTKAFDAAVACGLIPAKVAEMVTTTKQTKPSIRVTYKAKA